MQRLCADVLCPRPSEVVRLFLIPALAELPFFPFRETVEAIHDLDPKLHTPGLLLALLHLERRHFS